MKIPLSVGRNDDVVVLGSGKRHHRGERCALLTFGLPGEKIVPIPQENHIVSSPLAIGAVMFGWGKPQPGILIEPSAAYALDPTNEAELVKYRNLIWCVKSLSAQTCFSRQFQACYRGSEPPGARLCAAVQRDHHRRQPHKAPSARSKEYRDAKANASPLPRRDRAIVSRY